MGVGDLMQGCYWDEVAAVIVVRAWITNVVIVGVLVTVVALVVLIVVLVVGITGRQSNMQIASSPFANATVGAIVVQWVFYRCFVFID